MKAWVLGLGALLSACTLLGCKETDDCGDAAAAADKFLEDPKNLRCDADEDCAVVLTGCAPVANNFCGQSAVSKEAGDSATWSRIEKDLQSCDKDCAICAAALVPHCSAGKCSSNAK